MQRDEVSYYMDIGTRIDDAAAVLIDCLLARGDFAKVDQFIPCISVQEVEGDPFALLVDAHHVRLKGKLAHVFYESEFGKLMIGAIEFRVLDSREAPASQPLFRIYVDEEGCCGWIESAKTHRSISTAPEAGRELRGAILRRLLGAVQAMLAASPITG